MGQEKQLLETAFLKKFIRSVIEITPAPKPTIPPTNFQTSTEPINEEIPPITKHPIPNRHPPPKEIPYVKPKPGDLDLGKLNFLIADPWLQSIECQGPNKKILVRKGSQTLLTSLALNEEEIKNVINKFSQATRIPLAEGVLKALHNNLSITAITSDYLGSNFIIEKIPNQFHH